MSRRRAYLSQDSVADGTETDDVPISPMDSPDVVTQKQNTAKEVAMDRKLMRLDPIASAAVSISAGTATTLFGNDTAPTASVILTLKPGQALILPASQRGHQLSRPCRDRA